MGIHLPMDAEIPSSSPPLNPIGSAAKPPNTLAAEEVTWATIGNPPPTIIDRDSDLAKVTALRRRHGPVRE